MLVLQAGTADLDVYRHGASVVLHGQSLYGTSFAAHEARHLPFTYPPFAALAALVLLPLPGALTGALWAVATVLLLRWCVKTAFRPLLDRVARPDLVLVVLVVIALFTRPVFDHVGDGQVDILLMSVCLADTVTPEPRWPRGLLVGVATAIKLVPGFFILYFVVTRQRRAAVVAAVTFVAAETLALLAAPADSGRYWTRLVFDTERPGYTAGYKNQSLRAVLLHLPSGPGRTPLVVLGVIALALFGLARARGAWVAQDPLGAACLAGLTAVLVSPVSWIHAMVWIIPALGVLVGQGRDPRRVVAVVVTILLLVAGLPYVPNLVTGLPAVLVFVMHRSLALVGLALLLGLGRRGIEGGQSVEQLGKERAEATFAPRQVGFVGERLTDHSADEDRNDEHGLL
jgi:alpha-1,2-mannosyltransferase